MPGPLQQALLSLGITSPSLLTRGAGLDRASQRLLIEAADELPPATSGHAEHDSRQRHTR